MKKLFPKALRFFPILLSLGFCGCAAISMNRSLDMMYSNYGKELYDMGDYILAEQTLGMAAADARRRDLNMDKKANILYYLGETKRQLGKYDEAELALLEARAYAKHAWQKKPTESGMLNTAFIMLYRDMKQPEKGWIYVKNTFVFPPEALEGENWPEIYREYIPLLKEAGMSTEAEILQKKLETDNNN